MRAVDVEWFKQKQRKAGVTSEDIGSALGRDRTVVSRIYSGRQRMTLDQAKVFAGALEAPLAEILDRAGIMDAATVREIAPPGFGEGDASKWQPETGNQMSWVGDFAEFLGGGRAGQDIWRVKSRAMQLDGYADGDFLLVNHNAAPAARPGDVVIAQVYDWQSGTAVTLLRRYEPPVLIAASADPEDRKVHVVDGTNVVIRGIVTASWRGGERH